jgi:peptidylprolyl isomerase
MKKILILIIIATIVSINLFSVPKGEEMNYTKMDSGLEYVITEKGSGELATAGSRIKVHYTGSLEDGTKFDSSLDRGEPFTFELGAGMVIKGWDEGFTLLHVGDKAVLKIPPHLGYGERGAGGAIPPNATLIFEVELLEIMPIIKLEEFDIKGKVSSKTESGLEYILVEEGSGIKAAAGNTVSVHYTGYLEDGTMFDSSVKRGQPFNFILGMGRVIKGWDEGIALMKIGDKVRLIIPADLGYGERGAGGVIPPNATLVFDVELLEVK